MTETVVSIKGQKISEARYIVCIFSKNEQKSFYDSALTESKKISVHFLEEK